LNQITILTKQAEININLFINIVHGMQMLNSFFYVCSQDAPEVAEPVEKNVPSSIVNTFVNDGSFFAQFQRMQEEALLKKSKSHVLVSSFSCNNIQQREW